MNNDIARRMQEIIPCGFEHAHQFITYNLVSNPKFPGKFDKKPCNARGVDIDAHSREHWLTAEQALERVAGGIGHGIGFVLHEGDPFWFIDLDGSLINGRWSELAQRVYALFPGAAIEISQSGKGLHIFGSGLVPEHRKRVKLEGLGEIEFYTEGRFAALTGMRKQGDARLDFSHVMPQFIREFGLTPDPDQGEAAVWTSGVAPGCDPYELDGELIQRMLDSDGSARVGAGLACHPRDLWECNVQVLARHYPSMNPSDAFGWSEADLALVGCLYYWCGDLARTARLFMQSRLARPAKYEARPYLMTRMLTLVGRKPNQRFHQKGYRSAGGAGQVAGGNRTSPQAVGAASWGLEQTGYTPQGAIAANPALAATTAAVLRNFELGNTVNDIMAMDLPEPDYLVEGLIAPGMQLLIGKPKKGKSWMAMELALNVAIGGNFLQRRCKQGKVLYFALEDNRRRIKKRMAEMMPANFTTGTVDLRILSMEDKVQNMDRGFLQDLRHTLENTTGHCLVIIDTLSMVRFAKKSGEGIYDYDRRSVDPLTQLCADFPNLTIIVVHHARKNASDDPYDLASGTLGLTGAADGTFVLAHDPENGCMVFHGTGRDIEPVELAVKLNPPRWEVLGEPREVGLIDSQREIIDALKSTGVPMRMVDIQHNVTMSKSNLQGRLAIMVKHGTLMKEGSLYILKT